MPRLFWPAVLGAVLVASSVIAPTVGADDVVADGHQTRSEAPVERPSDTDVEPDERRDPAHYRGRENPTTPEEVLVWIPRILFAPLALVTDIVLRRPLVAIIGWIEQNHLVEIIEEVLNPNPNVSWSPTISFEVAVLALPGLQVEWRNALVEGHTFQMAGAFGMDDFWSASFSDKWQIGPAHLGIRGRSYTRPERPFYGLGPDSQGVRTYYREARTELLGFVGAEHGHHVRAELTFGYSREESGPGLSPSIETLDPSNTVPGMGLYELGIGEFDLTLDSRRTREEIGGVRLVGNTTFAFDARDESRSFMTVEVEIEAAVEVSAPDRVLGFRIYMMNTQPFGDAPIPFTRLAWLGGNWHRGFVRGRMRGDAAVYGELRYRYPVNYYFDAMWMAGAGNVFARDASDFDPGALTGTIGVGLRTRRTGMAPMEFTVAAGTSRFDAGFHFESVRFFFGTMYGL